MSLVVRRSDRFPVGTSVKAFAGVTVRHDGRPGGTAASEATVAADGSLTFSTLTPGALYTLYAEVGGKPVNMLAAASASFPALGTLQERIAASRLALGV
ncbi:MAG TPA: hypothetical protein VGN13_05490 [Solirubrobacteraceae bacterium]